MFDLIRLAIYWVAISVATLVGGPSPVVEAPITTPTISTEVSVSVSPNQSTASTHTATHTPKPISVATSTPVTNPPTPTPIPTSIYSDFILRYEVFESSYVCESDGLQGLARYSQIQLLGNTGRDIRITKIVLNAYGPTHPSIAIDNYMQAPLRQISNVRWELNKVFGVGYNPVIELYPSSECGHGTLEPVFREWKAWDYTTDKPVRIEPSTEKLIPPNPKPLYPPTPIPTPTPCNGTCA